MMIDDSIITQIGVACVFALGVVIGWVGLWVYTAYKSERGDQS